MAGAMSRLRAVLSRRVALGVELRSPVTRSISYARRQGEFNGVKSSCRMWRDRR